MTDLDPGGSTLEWLWTALPALACGAILLICVPMMMGRSQDQSDQGATKQEVAELRDELSRLKAQQALDDRTEVLDG